MPIYRSIDDVFRALGLEPDGWALRVTGEQVQHIPIEVRRQPGRAQNTLEWRREDHGDCGWTVFAVRGY